MANHNIVQAEFLYFKRGSSVARIVQDVFERAAEGGRASTVIRLYDERNTLTGPITRSSAVVDAGKAFLQALTTYTGTIPRNKLTKTLVRQMQQAEALESHLHRVATECFIAELADAIKQKRRVAVDNVDTSFRMARDDELHELLVSVKKAAAVNIFMFLPNDLLADKNTSVAYSLE